MSTKEKTPSRTRIKYPKAPTTIDDLVDEIINALSKEPATSETDYSSNIIDDDWKRYEASLVLSYLFNSQLRDKLNAIKGDKKTDSKEVFGDESQLKAFVFLLASDPYKHYNLSYYNEKLKELSDLAIRANKFLQNAFDLIHTLVRLIDFTKFHKNLYVTIDRFLLVGYDESTNKLTYNIDVKKFDSLLNVRKNDIIGLGLNNFKSVFYYRDYKVLDDGNTVEGKEAIKIPAVGRGEEKDPLKLFLGIAVEEMGTLYNLLRK